MAFLALDRQLPILLNKSRWLARQTRNYRIQVIYYCEIYGNILPYEDMLPYKILFCQYFIIYSEFYKSKRIYIDNTGVEIN